MTSRPVPVPERGVEAASSGTGALLVMQVRRWSPLVVYLGSDRFGEFFKCCRDSKVRAWGSLPSSKCPAA